MRGGVGRVFVCIRGGRPASSCWLQPGWGPGQTAHNPVESELTSANVSSLVQAWSVDLGDGGLSIR